MRPDSLELAESAGAWRSAYVHIPFCARVCPYCDFAVVAGQDHLVGRYQEALLTEIEMEDAWKPLDAIFIGGGTPSRVPASFVASVIDRLSVRFGLAGNVEITMEANPEDISAESAAGFATAGVNRMSLGVQSFDDDVLAALGRLHDADAARVAVGAAQDAVENLSVDLIYGDPSETDESWERTLAATLDLGVGHVSAYSLTVEPGTALSRAVASGADAPDDDTQADRWERAAHMLGGSFVRYEVSNYAVANPCRYNLSTWAQGEYLAFGLGAHGHRDGVRSRNVRRMDRYLERIEAGERPQSGSTHANEWEREQERLMLGLRRSAGVGLGIGGRQLLDGNPELVAAGIIEERGGRIYVVRPLLTDAVVREALALSPPE